MTAVAIVDNLIEDAPLEAGSSPVDAPRAAGTDDAFYDELVDVAIEPFVPYTKLLVLFCKVLNRYGEARSDDAGPDIDEACWRTVLTSLGFHDVPERAWEMADHGYELLRGEDTAESAWHGAVVALVDDRRALAVDGQTYAAVKKLWHFRYSPDSEESFFRYASQLKENKDEKFYQEMGNVATGKHFEQIGGDFGNPWLYGGTWHNAYTGALIHFPGVESEKEFEGKDKKIDDKLTTQDYRNIAGSLTLDDLDAWENIEDGIRETYATQLNDSRKFEYYRTFVEDDRVFEKDWAEHIAEIKAERGLDDAAWLEIPSAARQADVADRVGWYEFDHYPERITRSQLSDLVGKEL